MIKKESKVYASFALHGIKPLMQENGLKNPAKLSLKSHLCESPCSLNAKNAMQNLMGQIKLHICCGINVY